MLSGIGSGDMYARAFVAALTTNASLTSLNLGYVRDATSRVEIQDCIKRNRRRKQFHTEIVRVQTLVLMLWRSQHTPFSSMDAYETLSRVLEDARTVERREPQSAVDSHATNRRTQDEAPGSNRRQKDCVIQ